MRVSMATSAGRAGRPNEDFVGAVPGAVVLLDGAGIPGASELCSHGVAWYTHRLGGALLGGLASGGGDLAAILGAAISSVADSHRATCDLAHPNSPQATVAIVRASPGGLDYLLLADSYLVLGGGEVLTDEREVAARQVCSAPLSGVPVGTAEYARVLVSCRTEMRARRNQPGGYWIAKDDPRAAAEAVTGSRPVVDLALLSNGASRIVDPYGVTDWPGVLDLLRADGPAEVIRRVREAETRTSVDPDDATVAYGDMSEATFID